MRKVWRRVLGMPSTLSFAQLYYSISVFYMDMLIFLFILGGTKNEKIQCCSKWYRK